MLDEARRLVRMDEKRSTRDNVEAIWARLFAFIGEQHRAKLAPGGKWHAGAGKEVLQLESFRQAVRKRMAWEIVDTDPDTLTTMMDAEMVDFERAERKVGIKCPYRPAPTDAASGGH